MVLVLKKTAQLQAFRHDQIAAMGFVPTMGNLHAGHLALIKASLSQYPVTIVSIFVNPKQFAPHEDFARYPRTLEQDIAAITTLLQQQSFFTQKLVAVFAPQNIEEIYPQGYSTTISVGPHLTQILCGKTRPIHFDGVTTVMFHLLKLVRPQETFMGLKDYQQVHIIKKMVKDLDIPTKITGLPTVRDYDSLALSSRNQYLNTQERQQALTLPATLQKMREEILQQPNLAPTAWAQMGKTILHSDPAWEYLEVLDATTLYPPTSQTREMAILGAYRQGRTRLIDNVTFSLSPH